MVNGRFKFDSEVQHVCRHGSNHYGAPGLVSQWLFGFSLYLSGTASTNEVKYRPTITIK